MSKLRILFVFFLVQNISFSQEVLDTLHTEQGTMIIYTNRTWEYIEDRDFSGVLNPFLQAYFQEDSTLNFDLPWNMDECYPSKRSNDLTKLKDTIWLCAIDDGHNEFVIPHPGRVTSRYGWRKGRYHNGIDISLKTGDTVVSAFSGKVRYARYNEGGFGNLVVIRHYNGLETFYAHLSKHLVVPNQEVKAGQPIGLGGNSGRSKGSHLHFETRFYDAPMDPEVIIDFENQTLRSENLFIHRGLFYPGTTAAQSLNIAASSGAAVAQYHKVKSGDTLGHIAKKYGTTVSNICRLNNIRPTTTLKIGRTLRVK